MKLQIINKKKTLCIIEILDNITVLELKKLISKTLSIDYKSIKILHLKKICKNEQKLNELKFYDGMNLEILIENSQISQKNNYKNIFTNFVLELSKYDENEDYFSIILQLIEKTVYHDLIEGLSQNLDLYRELLDQDQILSMKPYLEQVIVETLNELGIIAPPKLISSTNNDIFEIFQIETNSNFDNIIQNPNIQTGLYDIKKGIELIGGINYLKDILKDSPIKFFQQQLIELNNMGFINESKNIKALEATDGNLDAAIEFLISEQL